MLAELALHTIATRHLPELSGLLKADAPESLPVRAATRRLYFGSEFCSHLLPTPTELETATRFAAEHDVPLSLVTPYGGDDLLDKLERLLDTLPEGSEVVANDWGVLRRVARDGRFVPVMGRLLSKLMRDPWVHREWAMADEPSTTTTQLPHRLMNRLGVRRAETDPLPGGTLAPIEADGFDLSVYLPWSPLGSGRVCFAGSFGRGRSPRFGVMDECSRPCRQVHIRLDERSLTEAGDVAATYLAGNTMLYRHPDESVHRAMDALPDGVTRVVWEPWIPA